VIPLSAETTPKHRHVFNALRREIQTGRWRPGDRLPSEAALVERFGVSRITVARAVRDLQHAGLVDRRAGSGTFVRGGIVAGALSFGVLIPDLGDTEIFESICQGMLASPLADQHALIWASVGRDDRTVEGRAWDLCRQYIDRQVSGVFFAPLEWTAERDEINLRIAQAFDAARIPLVLLDRPLLRSLDPARHDVVGIDNRHAGSAATDHLLRLGCRRVMFVGRKDAAATVDGREAGYREALYLSGRPIDPALIARIDPTNVKAVQMIMRPQPPDGIVCANDRTAAQLMRSLLDLGFRIPDDVRLVGVDDVEYARLLPVALTTLRQPTHAIGDVALAVMLERIHRPKLPPRHVQLQCELIVRDSCGGGVGRGA
jgi:GntR family transcriptional regulator, arabinose operon transcriptional repressor